jgi:hypothetical protein
MSSQMKKSTSAERTTRDHYGRPVVEGDTVRVVSCPPGVMAKLSAEERNDVASMVGKEYLVEEIDDHGSAWVTQWWDRTEGRRESHSLGLSPAEMELVRDAGGGR